MFLCLLVCQFLNTTNALQGNLALLVVQFEGYPLCKSSALAAGQVVVLGSQAGSGIWAGINLTITSTANNFQIAHNLANVAADFSIRICGTQ